MAKKTTDVAEKPEGTAVAIRGEDEFAIAERVVAMGDLSRITPEQRLAYYRQLCQSLQLNPLTVPFLFIVLNGKLTLYTTKTATDQLRTNRGITLVSPPEITYPEDLVVVRVAMCDASGRMDYDIGAVSIGGLKGNDKANAIMKALTKAKRRCTLSLSGLGFLDESEIETVRNARRVNVNMETGEIMDGEVVDQTLAWPEKTAESSKEGAKEPPAEKRTVKTGDEYVVPADFKFEQEWLDKARAKKLYFGQFMGKTLGEIEDTNKGYIAWLTDVFEPKVAGPDDPEQAHIMAKSELNIQKAARYIRNSRKTLAARAEAAAKAKSAFQIPDDDDEDEDEEWVDQEDEDEDE